MSHYYGYDEDEKSSQDGSDSSGSEDGTNYGSGAGSYSYSEADGYYYSEADGYSYSEADSSSYYEDENDFGTLEWCSCDECDEMEHSWERNCCHSHEQVAEYMWEYDVNCITYHPAFQSVVLDPFVLETAYYSFQKGPYRHGKISSSERGDYRMYRYMAYRQLVRWCWGILGHENRVDLPSCAIIAIRNTFPPGYSNAPEYS